MIEKKQLSLNNFPNLNSIEISRRRSDARS